MSDTPKLNNAPYYIKEDVCIGCGTCESVCPNSAVSINADSGSGAYKIDADKCKDCDACVEQCPVTAIWELESNKTE
ncbi:MAG: 4Fe-4S binding protein [Alphaproteobacteria bacterium]|nr:4Fe-4S binding protein [Alphaproteobacteria bacterium]MBL0717690.1 4Fe-4S binding protein [Alphaproteobacteria bacterium]